MIFLIEYDRQAGRRVSLTEFPDDQRQAAEDARLSRELALNELGSENEVVLLEASDLDALKRTHRRYFADLRELIEEFASSTSTFVVRERKE
ncbi:MAG TPA: hypothetical protein VGJ78_26015 [Vicinamibacterales bacterium]|jgi:hypothetical protein